jgi:hypothetical protein
MISSSTANDLTLSTNLNDTKTEKSAYDNLTNSVHYPLNKKSNQHFIDDQYDNYPIISNQPQNSLGILSSVLFQFINIKSISFYFFV